MEPRTGRPAAGAVSRRATSAPPGSASSGAGTCLLCPLLSFLGRELPPRRAAGLLVGEPRPRLCGGCRQASWRCCGTAWVPSDGRPTRYLWCDRTILCSRWKALLPGLCAYSAFWGACPSRHLAAGARGFTMSNGAVRGCAVSLCRP